MRIAVANLTSGGMSGGYRKYLSRLMPLMADDRRVSSLTVFVPAGAGVSLDPSLDLRSWSPEDARSGYAALAGEIAQLRPDVVFVPTARHAAFGSIPVVTMVRNMEPLTVPFGGNTWSEGLRNLARACEARRACRRATRVIAVSNYVRDFILSRWHLDPDRVGVAYHGVDRPEHLSSDNDAHTSRVLFTAGSIRPARGLEDVVRALAVLDREVRLLIAGRVDPKCCAHSRRLRRLASNLGVDARITWAGELAGEEMERAFRRCAVFVMTSRVEACPNTVLEAMSHGCASVSVNRPPMPEFFGEAALYYPVGAHRELASSLERLLTSSAERVRLTRAALARATQYSWEATRDRTIQELERTLR